MDSYSKAAMERAMKIQEVILRAMAKKITWWQAAEILGFSDRHLRRIRERYEQFGYESLFDKRRGQASPKRVPRPNLLFRVQRRRGPQGCRTIEPARTRSLSTPTRKTLFESTA